MAGGPVEIEHGDRIAAALRTSPLAMKQALRKSNAQVGREVRGWLRAATAGGTAQQRHMAKGIGSGASSAAVTIAVRNTASAPGAAGAFFGSKAHSQFPAWVGNSWKIATPGQGPYVVNPALAKHEADIETIYLQGQLDAVARAFPSRLS